ncbi:tetratricopeptide repeat protein [candidate division KSB1 bacterium]|nr:tetratricopeptide repeat protein [candidate division KSB1 bacterium]
MGQNIACEQAISLMNMEIDAEELSVHDHQQLKSHLAQCEACRVKYHQLKQVNLTITSALDAAAKKHLSTEELGSLLDGRLDSLVEINRMQRHLKSCESCREANERMKVLDQLEPMFELNIEPGAKKTFSEWVKALKQRFAGSRFSWIPATRILVPVAVSLFLVIFGYHFYQSAFLPASISELADSKPYPYVELGLRETLSPADRLFKLAMKDYVNGDYNGAAEKLQQVALQDSSNALARLYWGVCLFLEENYDQAELQFNSLIRNEPGKPAAYWYLAQVYLKKNEPKAALSILKQFEEMETNRFTEKARDQIEKIEKLQEQAYGR